MPKEDASDALLVMMSVDALAGPERPPEDVIPVVRRLVRLVTAA